MKNTSLLYIAFQFWERTSAKSYKIQLPLYLFLFYLSFNTSRYQFSWLFRLHSTLSEKDFRRKFSFLNRFTHLHTFDPLNGQNLLSGTKKFFCQFSLRCPLKHLFSKICRQSPVKASFMYQQKTTTATEFLNKVLTIDSLTLFSEHISRLTILTQASYLL